MPRPAASRRVLRDPPQSRACRRCAAFGSPDVSPLGRLLLGLEVPDMHNLLGVGDIFVAFVVGAVRREYFLKLTVKVALARPAVAIERARWPHRDSLDIEQLAQHMR